MDVKEIAEYLDMTESEVLKSRTREIGKVTVAWRCGETGNIAESEYECSCDSVFCGLGERVTCFPETAVIARKEK